MLNSCSIDSVIAILLVLLVQEVGDSTCIMAWYCDFGITYFLNFSGIKSRATGIPGTETSSVKSNNSGFWTLKLTNFETRFWTRVTWILKIPRERP